MRIAWLLALVVAARTADAVPCFPAGYKATLLSPQDTEGAIVIGVLPDRTDRTPADPRVDLAIQGWNFSDGTAPKVQSIAPGLAIYSGKGQLLDKLRNPVATVRPLSGAGQPLAAPAIKAVTYEPRRNRGDGESVSAELSKAPPAGAVALVVFDSNKQGRSFGVPVGSATQITVYGNRSCTNAPPTTIASKKGDSIYLAWLDDHGRLSAMTAATIR